MPRTKAIVGVEEIAGHMKGLRSARQQSPFFTMVIRDEWLVSFDYAIVIHSIHSMLKNSIHSIQKLMNGPTGLAVRPYLLYNFSCVSYKFCHIWSIFEISGFSGTLNFFLLQHNFG